MYPFTTLPNQQPHIIMSAIKQLDEILLNAFRRVCAEDEQPAAKPLHTDIIVRSEVKFTDEQKALINQALFDAFEATVSNFTPQPNIEEALERLGELTSEADTLRGELEDLEEEISKLRAFINQS